MHTWKLHVYIFLPGTAHNVDALSYVCITLFKNINKWATPGPMMRVCYKAKLITDSGLSTEVKNRKQKIGYRMASQSSINLQISQR